MRTIFTCFLTFGVVAAGFVAIALAQEIALPPSFTETLGAHPTIIHRASHFVFPTSIGDFAIVDVHEFDDAGADVSVGYNNLAIPVAATVYVYPTGGRTLSAEFKSRQAEITETHRDATLLRTGTTKITAKKVTALAAVYRFRDNLGGEIQPLQSTLLVAQKGARFVEYRFTYPADQAKRVVAAITRFVERLGWP